MDQKTMVDEWWWNVTVTTLHSECNEALFVYTSVQIIIVYKCKSKQLPCWGEIESVMKPPRARKSGLRTVQTSVLVLMYPSVMIGEILIQFNV